MPIDSHENLQIHRSTKLSFLEIQQNEMKRKYSTVDLIV